jgi:alkylation response protein AidB-like acyl-CoA dehydrogenase
MNQGSHPLLPLREHERTTIARWQQIARDHLQAIAVQGRPHHVNKPLVAALGHHELIAEILRRDDARVISSVRLCLLREALAEEVPEAETALALQGLGGYPILKFGSPAVRSEWSAGIIAGSVVMAFALTEPAAGSDVGALQLTAERVSGGYRLNGVKTYISNAPDADLYTVFARTTHGNGTRGITALAVPGNSPGLRGERLRLISPHPIGRLQLDDVFAPDDHVLGDVDGGFKVAMDTLNLFRPSVGAYAIGLAHVALQAAVAHVNIREMFGRHLRDMQAVAHRLAELATQLEAARLLVYEAAAVADHGTETSPVLSAMAKLLATETAQTVVDFAIQVHGAKALEEGHLLEVLYREVRAPRIYEGASEVQREIIARRLLASS